MLPGEKKIVNARVRRKGGKKKVLNNNITPLLQSGGFLACAIKAEVVLQTQASYI